MPVNIFAKLAKVKGFARESLGRTGDTLHPEHVGRVMTETMWRSGVKNARYDGRSGHALRHTAASDVLDRCGDLRVVQELLGHEDLSTTAIYLRRVSAERMREAVEGRSYTG